MNQEKRLAVVVPVYNEPRIQQTLKGLHNQDYRNGVYHFVVDNGSTDNTREYIDSFLLEHKDFPLSVIEKAPKRNRGSFGHRF